MATQILRPNGVGTLTQWDFPLLGNHWEKVDEVSQDGDTTHISDNGITIPNGSAERDVFALDGWTHGAQHIEKVEVTFWGRLSQGTGKITPLLHIDSTGDYTVGSIETLTGSYAAYTQELSRPGGGNWNYTDMDDLQVGVESSAGGGSKLGNNIRCTQIYVTVTYNKYFSEMSATGWIAPVFIEPELNLMSDDADIEDPEDTGDDFDKELSRVTNTVSTLVVGVASLSTETSYFYTKVGDPRNDDWETGPWDVTVNPYGNVTHGNLRIRVRISRIDNTLSVSESSGWSDWNVSPWDDNTPFTLEVPNKDWTAGARSDRIRLDFQYEKTTSGIGAFGIYLDDGTSYLRTMVHQWRTDTMGAIGHVIQGRSDAMGAIGHVIQRRTSTKSAIGHIISPSPSPSPSPPPSPETREDTISATGHVTQERTTAIDATGHTLQRRIDTKSATGFIVKERKKKLILFDVSFYRRIMELVRKAQERRERDDEKPQKGLFL